MVACRGKVERLSGRQSVFSRFCVAEIWIAMLMNCSFCHAGVDVAESVMGIRFALDFFHGLRRSLCFVLEGFVSRMPTCSWRNSLSSCCSWSS